MPRWCNADYPDEDKSDDDDELVYGPKSGRAPRKYLRDRKSRCVRVLDAVTPLIGHTIFLSIIIVSFI